MPCVETKIVINGDSKPIFEIIKNMEAYPSFMHDLVSVEILERGENTTVSHWVSNVDGRKIVWTERDTFYPEEMRITYCQTEGDLKKMEGEWRLVPVSEGTEVSLLVDFEFGIPMIAGLLNPILKKKVRENSENMLTAVKAQIEAINNSFEQPLPYSEVKATAKSIARWVWRNHNSAEFQQAFSEKQAKRGKKGALVANAKGANQKGGKARSKQYYDMRQEALKMQIAGKSIKEISTLLNVHRNTVSNWLKDYQKSN